MFVQPAISLRGVGRRKGRSSRGTRVRMSYALAMVAMLALPAVAAADDGLRGAKCVGLECAGPLSPDYVPEAHGAVPVVAGIDELSLQRESGFYEIPAPVYQGDVQPRAVVYLSKPGQLGKMPESVRDLAAMKGVEQTRRQGVRTAATLVIIDSGILYQDLGGLVAAARKGPKARAAHAWHGCSDLYYCMYAAENWTGLIWGWYGPTYYGTGWWNIDVTSFWNNQAESMVNHRDGDTLMANLHNGDGARYCARQQSDDGTFSNNNFNNQASSVALLGSTPDRC